MALSLENLTAIDYDMLEFINKNGKISKDGILAKFHDKVTGYRKKTLEDSFISNLP